MRKIESYLSPELVEKIQKFPMADEPETKPSKWNPNQIAVEQNKKECLIEILNEIIKADLETLGKPRQKNLPGESKNKLAEKFIVYIKCLFRQHPDLLKAEWNQHFVAHADDAKINSILDSHYVSSLGMPKSKDSGDDFRDKLEVFLETATNLVRGRVNKILEENPKFFAPHPNPDFNTLETYLAVLGWAMLSHFVRGAIFDSIRFGENSPNLSENDPIVIGRRILTERGNPRRKVAK